MNTKEKLKKHFSDNKKLYFGIAIGAVVAGTGVYIWKARSGMAETPVFSEGSTVVTISNAARVDTVINNSGSIINLIRRGHPGNVVEHLESGEQFASQARAAEVFGVSASRMSKRLRGLIEDIDGEHFRVLREAV